MLYFFILGISIFTCFLLTKAVENWEENVPNCLSCPTYYLTRSFCISTTMFTLLMGVFGWMIWWKDKEGFLKFSIIVSLIWFVAGLFMPLTFTDLVDGDCWKLTIRKNDHKAEEMFFIGNEKEASVRLYEEIEKTCLLYRNNYEIELCGTTSPRFMKIIKNEDKIVGFEGILEGNAEYFQFKIEKE